MQNQPPYPIGQPLPQSHPHVNRSQSMIVPPHLANAGGFNTPQRPTNGLGGGGHNPLLRAATMGGVGGGGGGLMTTPQPSGMAHSTVHTPTQTPLNRTPIPPGQSLMQTPSLANGTPNSNATPSSSNTPKPPQAKKRKPNPPGTSTSTSTPAAIITNININASPHTPIPGSSTSASTSNANATHKQPFAKRRAAMEQKERERQSALAKQKEKDKQARMENRVYNSEARKTVANLMFIHGDVQEPDSASVDIMMNIAHDFAKYLVQPENPLHPALPPDKPSTSSNNPNPWQISHQTFRHRLRIPRYRKKLAAFQHTYLTFQMGAEAKRKENADKRAEGAERGRRRREEAAARRAREGEGDGVRVGGGDEEDPEEMRMARALGIIDDGF